MYLHEEIFMKISDDFHREINSLLTDIDPEVKSHFWYDLREIRGKFFILNDFLTSLHESDVSQLQILALLNTLKKYKMRLENYYQDHGIATCFYFMAPEDPAALKTSIKKWTKYTSSFSWRTRNGLTIMIGIDMIGFPIDCNFKLIGHIREREISITKQQIPFSQVEIDRGVQISNTRRTLNQQREIEAEFIARNHDLVMKVKSDIEAWFMEFCQDVHKKLITLLSDFDQCIDMCLALHSAKSHNTYNPHLPYIEKVFDVLNGKYLDVSLEKFAAIFRPDYQAEKIIWLKSGPQLKYFLDKMNEKLQLTEEINKWAKQRFQMKIPVKNLAVYLGKQRIQGEYQLLSQGSYKKEPLYKIFRE